MCCNLAFREVDWHKWVEDLVNMVDAKCVCVCVVRLPSHLLHPGDPLMSSAPDDSTLRLGSHA